MEALRYPVTKGIRELKQIALTFDGGSVDTGAREILKILAEKKIVTTVFLTGQFIEKFPASDKRAEAFRKFHRDSLFLSSHQTRNRIRWRKAFPDRFFR